MADAEFRPPSRGVRLRKVLVVDRDAFWGPAIHHALEESGYYLNSVADAQEGQRRSMERAYDLVIVSESIGQAALQGILETLSRRARPAAAIVLTGEHLVPLVKGWAGVPRLRVLRRPFAIEDVVDAARALVGVPWSEHRQGA
jgi:DNA-binding response OmpR family regulator